MQKQWIYTFNKKFDQNQKELLVQSINKLLTTWKTHGKDLEAEISIFQEQLLIIYLDEKSTLASGCAVDTLNREIISVVDAEGLELADRNKIPLFYRNNIEFVERSNLKILHDQAHITAEHTLIDIQHPFDRTKGFDQFLVPIYNSWLKEYLH